MDLFLWILLGLLLIVAAGFYFSREGANYDPKTRSYSRETPEVREKNRKAVRAWLARQRAARPGAASASVQQVQAHPSGGCVGKKGLSSLSVTDKSIPTPGTSPSSHRISDALFVGSMVYMAARAADSSTTVHSDSGDKDSASSSSNDAFYDDPEAWEEDYPDYEDDSQVYSCSDSSDCSDGWKDGYEEESDW